MLSFKWRHFEKEIILLNVRWYLAYPLSYRNLEKIAEGCAAADMARHEGKHLDAVPKYESVLMLCGAQGFKKTSFIKYLLPKELHKYTKDSVQLNVKDKDSLLNIT